MTDNTERSPLPWTRTTDGSTILDSSGEYVWLYCNLDQILTAVNSHDDLVKALEAAEAYLKETIPDGGTTKIVCAALKKAREQ